MEEEKDINTKKTYKYKYLKKGLKVLTYIVIGVIGLNILLFLLLLIPAVQKSVVNFALDQVRPIVKTEISIDEVHIGLFNHVNMKGVYIESQSKDTLAYAGNLDVKISLWKLLFSNKLQINSLELNDAVFNVSQDSIDTPYNFQFLIDAFASSDTVPQDTSESSMKIAIEGIKITNTRLNYDILSEPETPGIFNPSHISVKNFNSELSLASIDIFDLDVTINSLSLIEKSGFAVQNLEGVLLSQNASLFSKKLTLNLPHSFLDISDFEFNLLSQELTAKVNSEISPLDISPFMRELKQLKNNIIISSNISGKLPAISVDHFTANYGEDLTLQAKASISDYSNYGESKMNLDIEKLRITPKAIVQFARVGDSTFVAPDMLSSIEYLRLKGSADGYLSGLNVNAEAWTNQGSVLLSGMVATDTTFEDFRVDTKIQTQNLNLAAFAGPESGLGRLTMHTNIKVASVTNLSAQVDGVVDVLQYQKNDLKNIRFKAQYSPTKTGGWIYANLPVGKIEGEAYMAQGRTQDINFDIDIRNLKTDAFYKNPSWENPQLNVSLTGKLKGKDIDNLQGFAQVDSLKFWGDNFNYQPGKFRLETGVDNANEKFISLKSSLLNANVSGEYHFLTLADELSNIMYAYLPGFFKENKRVKNYKNNFDVNVSVANTEAFGQIFDLPFDIIEPVTILGTVNTTAGKINMNANIPYIKFGEMDIKEGRIGLYNTESTLSVNSHIKLPEGKTYTGFDLETNIKSDTIDNILTVKNNGSEFNIDGRINALAHFEQTQKDFISNIRFNPTDFQVGDLKFAFLPASIVNKGNETLIENFGIALNNKRYFGIDGTVSNSKEDTVRVYFDHAQIGDILTAFKINNIKAEANGQILLTNTLDQPELYTKGLNLTDIIIFADTLGTLDLESKWNNSQQAITFDASLINKISKSELGGFVSTSKDSIELSLNLDRLSLSWLVPFMEGTLNEMSGSISSKIKVKGSMASPRADGWLGFNDMYIGADYTNVRYHISDTIKVRPDSIGFRNLVIQDNNKNKAVLSALVSHKNFQNFEYLANLNLDKFLILNTPNRTDSLFYGKLLASGNVRVRGNAKDINVRMNVRNEDGSKINITIPQVSEASDYESIVYINVPKEDSTTYVAPTLNIPPPLPLRLTTAITLNPKLELGVVINPATGDALHMKGSALVNFSYDMAKDDMKVYGDYIIEDGSVRLRIQGIKTLQFKIREGSKVSLTGDPMSASFNITAYQRVRASLATLDASFSTSKVYVDCVLGIKGNMQKMDLTYDVSLPESNEDIQQKVRSLINTDEKKTRQFAYLIAMGAFEPLESGIGSNNSNLLTNVASGALSNVLGSLLGGVLGKNFEIGTDISSNDGTFNDVDVRVNVSTRIFDDKLKLNTNLGYRTDQTSTSSDEQLIGDFDMEYDLTNTVKLKAFNRTNDRIYKSAPTTQGIGIVYTKEAKKIKDLFRSVRRKNRQPDNRDNRQPNR